MQLNALLLFSGFGLLSVVGCAPTDSKPPAASAHTTVLDEAPAKTFQYAPAHPTETRVFTDEEYMTAARKVLVQDSFVVIGDSRGDSLIHVLDTTGRYLGSMGRNGQGPGEFMTVWWMVEGRPSNPGLWFYDIGNQRLTHHNFSQYPDNIVEGDPLSIQLRHEGVIAFVEWLDEHTFLGTGSAAEGRFVYFDREGNAVRNVGALPAYRTDAPINVRQRAYTGYTQRHPTDSLLVDVSRFSDRLTIYDFDGNVLHLARTSDPFEPVDYIRMLLNENPAPGEDLAARYGYLDVTANADVIYTLFSGRTDASSNYTQLVFAFDWEGNFLKAYELDTEVISITLAPSGNSLFAVRHYPSPAILQVELE